MFFLSSQRLCGSTVQRNMKTTKKPPRTRTVSPPTVSGGAQLRARDPFLEREQSRYEHPLPSREHILDVLLEQGVPVSEEDLARLLAIAQHEIEFFERRLGAMERDGQMMRNRKNAICVVEKLDLVKRQGAGASGWIRISSSRTRAERICS